MKISPSFDKLHPFISRNFISFIGNTEAKIIKVYKDLLNDFSKVKKDTIADKLNSLRENKQVENYELKISETINSIKKLSYIAEMLHLPPTIVFKKL